MSQICHKICGGGKENMEEGKKTWWNDEWLLRLLLRHSTHGSHSYFISQGKSHMCIPSSMCFLLREGTGSHMDKVPEQRSCVYVIDAPVFISRYRAQWKRKVLTRFWALTSGLAIAYFLLAIFSEVASPPLYIRVLILAKYVCEASLILCRFVQG